MKKISYADFKQFVSTKKAPVQFVDFTSHYIIQAKDGYFEYETVIVKDSNADQTDFEAGIKLTANQSIMDTDGATLVRVKAAKTAWTYGVIPIEFRTADFNSTVSILHDLTNRIGVSTKFYDNYSTEVTDVANEAQITRTVVDFEPTYNYEIIGGQVQQHTKPNTDIRVWVTAVPDIPVGSGGSKEMVGGVNLRFIDPSDKIEADGKASKFMKYDATYHTNKLRFTIRHDAGVQHDLLILLNIFRA
jgi:hypothetical protein